MYCCNGGKGGILPTVTREMGKDCYKQLKQHQETLQTGKHAQQGEFTDSL